MGSILSNPGINYKKCIISRVEDTNGTIRTNISVYELLTEMEIFTETRIDANDFRALHHKTFIIDGFEVSYRLNARMGYLIGCIHKYVGQDRAWIDPSKLANIYNGNAFNFYPNHDRRIMYSPHGDFTGQFEFDCGHAGTDLMLFADAHGRYIPASMRSISFGEDQTFKSAAFVQNELKKIVSSIREYISRPEFP